MGKLIVNGNSVYEVDENCMRKRKRKNKDASCRETEGGRKEEYRKGNAEKNKAKRG